nr:hypothetical protein [Tanacetum cinerariifolium]
MPPKMTTRSAGWPAAASRGEGTGGRAGRTRGRLVTKVEVKEMVGIKTAMPSMTTSGVMLGMPLKAMTMESIHDMSGCRDSQRVKYTAGSFVGKDLTWWNFKIRTRGQEAAVGMSWEDFRTLTREESFLSNEMQKWEAEL